MLDTQHIEDTAPEAQAEQAQAEQAQPVSRGLNKRAEHTKPKRTRYVPRYIPGNDLGRTVGIEVTFIPAWFEQTDGVDFGEVNSAIKGALYRRIKEAMGGEIKARKRVSKFSVDPDVIEIPTAKHKTRSRLMETLNILHDNAADLNMAGFNDWHPGGGAHIHVGLRPDEVSQNSAFVQALYRDLTHRPYLTWAFCGRGDHNQGARAEALGVRVPAKRTKEQIQHDIDKMLRKVRDARKEYAEAYQTAKSYAIQRWTPTDGSEYQSRRATYINGDIQYYLSYQKAAARDLIKYRAELAAYTDGSPSPEAVHAESIQKWCAKAYGVTYRRDFNTLEWRMFRASNDSAGHERHLNFALAYMEHIERIVTKGKAWGKIPAAHYKADADKLKQDWGICRAVREFKATVRMLGLRVRDYAEDIDNMRAYFDLHMPKPVYVVASPSTWTVIPLRPENVPAYAAPAPVELCAEPDPEPTPEPVVPFQRRGRAYNSQPTVRRSEVALQEGDTITMRAGHIRKVLPTTAPDRWNVGVIVASNGRHNERHESQWDVIIWNGVRVIPDKKNRKPVQAAPTPEQTDTGPILRSQVEFKHGDTYVLRSGTEGTVVEDNSDASDATRFGFGLWGNKHGKIYGSDYESMYTPIVINGRSIIEDSHH